MPTSVLEREGVRTFGQRVRLCRHAHGYRAAEFAAMLGVSRPYLSALENDHGQTPSVPLLQRMAQTLHVTTSQLLGETPLF